jgi:hypothetical protein
MGLQARGRAEEARGQSERGQAPWSDADPEVWIGNRLIGRLAQGGDIADSRPP